ncbi:uracil-DNA glycosylase [Rhizorhabdus wittichii DC-6]|uniref:Uracil-DNA glycosylase superfamily n=1 Tax=Rhizorhabdus wittichii (strain DSM 6014 / CCUG 31198 / JCM 15750 / NBRC 105917 / EY 4224 / RW1) TaxID=392499 RepID=A0A9J9LE75_RHIWR|nr:Uracil-DNA glycosylase superfamily [Rhizorhabdus wittichii RW1]ARR52604.1 uracil-DNA glycosylase [Rhizorhabdus wittichii DC-6]
MSDMDLGASLGSTAEITSLMGWWEDAGLDVLVDEAPRDWLARVVPPVARPVAAVAAPAPVPAQPTVAAPIPAQPAARAAAFPDTLDGFQSWLATSDEITMPMSARIAASGDPATGLMVLVDLPEAEDPANGRLLSGPAGDLFDKMLGAMGRDRQSLYLSAMAPGRPSGGFVDPTQGALFGRLARHHVLLAQPRALLLMGEQPSRTFLNLGFVEARGRVHDVQLPGGAVNAVATFHPRTLLQHPQQKRRAWEDLQLLMKLLG